MKITLISLILCVLCILSVNSQSIGLEDWSCSKNAEIIEKAKDGSFIGVKYKVPKNAEVWLRPKTPVILPADLTRINCWFARIKGDFDLFFELKDASGKKHIIPVNTSRMTSRAELWRQDHRRYWSVWNQAETPYLQDSSLQEIAQRVPKSRYQESIKGYRPKPYVLTGIKILPKPFSRWHAYGAFKDARNGLGEFWITDLAWENKDAFNSEFYWLFQSRLRLGRKQKPVIFLDDCTSINGPVRYRVELRKGYFGKIIWSKDGTVNLNRSDAMGIFRQRIEIPDLPEGRYFIQTKAWGPGGVLERDQPLLRYCVLSRKSKSCLPTSTPDFEIRTDRPDNVFPADTRQAGLNILMPHSKSGKLPPQALCSIEVIDRKGKPVYMDQMPLTRLQTANVKVEPGEDYFVKAEIIHDGKVYDRAHMHFGVKNDFKFSPEYLIRDQVKTLPELINNRAGMTSEYWIGARSRTFPWVLQFDPVKFDQWCKLSAKAGATVVTVGDSWSSHEILPGVFQVKEMEEQINIAKKYGLKVIFAYSGDNTSMRISENPFWLDADILRDQNGETSRRSTIRFSYWADSYRSGKQNFYRVMSKYFLNNPDVAGYRIHSHLIPSLGYKKNRMDYSSSSREHYAKYLKDNNLPAMKMVKPLNVTGKPFSKVGPDLSPEWYNFMKFSSYTIDTSIEDQFNAIRSNDDKRPVIVDQKPFAYAIESVIPALKNGGALKNEDSPNLKMAALRSMCSQANVPYVEELHNHMPTSMGITDATDFWGSYHSKTIFWLFRGHLRLLVDKAPKITKGSWVQLTENRMLDYLAETRPAWSEWISATEPEPEILVFGSRAQGFLGDRRMGGEMDMAGVDTFLALFSSHQLNIHMANEYTYWVDLNKFKVVFACGEIMPASAIDRLVKYAENGGKLVLVGDAGRYCAEDPRPERSLLTRLKGNKNIKFISKPGKIPGGENVLNTFDAEQVDKICSWAAVKRKVEVKSQGKGDGFECQFRFIKGKDIVYVAIMRRWNGWYWQNIERDELLGAKHGLQTAEVYINDLPAGDWKIEQIHREKKTLGVKSVNDGTLKFTTKPALAAEAMIFRLTRQK